MGKSSVEKILVTTVNYLALEETFSFTPFVTQPCLRRTESSTLTLNFSISHSHAKLNKGGPSQPPLPWINTDGTFFTDKAVKATCSSDTPVSS